MRWIIEPEVFGKEVDAMISEVKAQGHDLTIIPHKLPYNIDWIDLVPEFEEGPKVFYGSLRVGAYLNVHKDYYPGVYSTSSYYPCVKYYPIFGDMLLNSEYIMMPHGDLKRCKQYLFSKAGSNGQVFIRPNRADKLFSGKVTHEAGFSSDFDIFGDVIDSDELCLLSKPKTVVKEWRFLVVDHRVVDGTQYLPEESSIAITSIHDDAQIAFRVAIESVTKAERRNFTTDKAWTLDVCKTDDNKFHVLECGGFSCAGLYKMDMKKVVAAVSDAAIADWNDIYDE